MADKIIEEHPADGTGATHTTVIHEGRRSSGTGIVMAVIVLIAVIGGLYLFSQSSSSDAAKDDAVAEAANKVGNAATKIGNSAEEAVDKATQ